jgi:hypothetical protein
LVTGFDSLGANVYGGGMSLAVGAYSYSYSFSSSSGVSGSTTVSSTSYTISSNTLTNCRATSLGTGRDSFGANVYGGGMSLAVGAYFYSNSFSSSSSSSVVSGSTMVSSSSYFISSNTLTSCSALSVSGSGSSGSNVYGGGMSLAVGAYSYSFSSSSSSIVSGSTTVSSSSYFISSNTLTNCIASSSVTGRDSFGSNVYGGGMSLAVGAYSYSYSFSSRSSSGVSGSTMVSSSSYFISSNTLTNCIVTSSVTGFDSYGANVYGGGMSLAVGAYSYSYGSTGGTTSIIGFSGSTMVSSTSYTISSNTLTNCSATSSDFGQLSFGANVYGGGMSLAVGAYSYSYSKSTSSSSGVSGSTMVSNSSYTISSNTLTNCSATSLVTGFDSLGSNVYGGGMSLAVGAYSYSQSESSSSGISGSTTVSSSSYTISSNTLTNCSATSSVTGRSSYGANVYGGGLSLAVGAYSWGFSSSSSGSSSSGVSGSTTVSSTSYTISSNTLTNCRATSLGTGRGSFGSNVYGGGMSLAVGAYSYSFSGSSSDDISGNTTVSSSSYFISSNTLTNCSATSSVTGLDSFGSNVYGGGMSLAVGAYSYSYSFSQTSIRSSSVVSGSTMVSSSSYFISSNTLTNCRATSLGAGRDSFGANVFGGGMSLAVGVYSYSYDNTGGTVSISSVSGSTMVSSSSYFISSNTLTNCSATSSVTGRDSLGSNVYGGGMSLAVGAYSYSFSLGFTGSSVAGSTMVSSSSYFISSNTLTNCSATSSVTGRDSFGAIVYGGGMSLAVGAYSYSYDNSGGIFSIIVGVSGSTMVSNSSYTMSGNVFAGCSALSHSIGASNGASAYGGAFSIVHNASSFPSNTSNFVRAIGVLSVLHVSNCSFSECKSTTSSKTCASGSSNAAGGAVFALVHSLAVEFVANLFSNATSNTACASSSSSTYSLGGGMCIFQAGNVNLRSTNFTRCLAQGVSQSNNVFVSGGGLHVQASDSFSFQNGLISDCGVRDAFSTFLQSGGGALGTQNVSFVEISDSIFRDNSDSSSSGSIFLQQLKNDRGMNVTMDRSHVLNEPSNTPALNISCGSNCSQAQQQRINIRFQNVNMSAHSETRTNQYVSSAMMTLPASSSVDSDRNSSLNCLFNFTINGAILITNTGALFLTFSCAPCARTFEIAQTSRTLELSNFENVKNLGNQLCQSIAPRSTLQQCPFGVPFCSTIVNVSVGFWANFSADGKLGNAIQCPRNYCGCNNIPNFTHSSCLLEPPLSPTFRFDVQTNDNLCGGNRCGVLCGGCKQNFTHSLNGYSCVSNDDCLRDFGWVWTVTVIGFVLYSIYIVFTSVSMNDGFINCVLFYGQMSSFARIPPVVNEQANNSETASWFSKSSQFSSILSAYQNSCYGPSMGAYEATAAQLIGPLTVFLSSMLLIFPAKLLKKKFHHFLRKRRLDVTISFQTTLMNLILMLFSSVSSVVFQLITCQDTGQGNVVFIDGTKSCSGAIYNSLVFVAAMLSLVPLLIWAGLKFNKVPSRVRAVLCSPYTDAANYWVALALLFRFLVSVLSATIRQFSSVTAVVLSVCTVCMLMVLMAQRPYADLRTYYMEIFCYFCLIVQFLLQCLVGASESLGLSLNRNSRFYETVRDASTASATIQFVFFFA